MTSEDWARVMTKVVAAGIKRLRGDRTVQWVSDRTAELGHTVSRSRISDIEGGKRGGPIGVAELIVIAEALDVPPLELLYCGVLVTGEVAYLPGLTMTGWEALMRFTGDGPPARHTPLRSGRERHLMLMRELVEHLPQRRSDLQARLAADLRRVEEARQELAKSLPIPHPVSTEELNLLRGGEGAYRAQIEQMEQSEQMVELDRANLESLNLYAQSLIDQLRKVGYTVELDTSEEEQA